MNAELRLVSKSGLSVKHQIEVGAGEIDEGYTGEIKVHLYNFGSENFEIEAGQKITQGVIDFKPLIEIVEIEDLDETDRGKNGFGSRGKK